MKKYIRKIINKILKAAGIDKVLQSDSVQDKKLLKGNAILGNKRIYRFVCIGITFFILFGINILGRLFSNLGGIVLGNVSTFIMFIPSFKLIPAYLIGVILSGAICVYLHFKFNISFQDLNVNQKGRARFLTHKEIAERFPCVPEKEASFPGWGGIPVSRLGKNIYIDSSAANAIVFAITRAGKTEGLAIPTIDIVSRAELKASMIIPDVKGTLCNASIPHLLERGYQVYVIDFFNFEFSNFYNPLEVIKSAYWDGNIDLAEELCADLAHFYFPEKNVKDPFWVNGPRSLYSACILGLIEDCYKANTPEKVTPYSVFVLLATLGKIRGEEKLKEGLDDYFASRSVNSPARLAYTAIDFSEGKTRTSLLSITSSQLDAFRRSNIAKLTSKSDFLLTELGFGEKPVAVFLRVPFYNRDYDAVVSNFISQSFYMNMQKAAMENNGKMARRVLVVADEFFNFPADPNLHNKVTVGVGSGWYYHFYAQSEKQPKEKYGEDIAKIVLDNCANRYFLASPDKDTRESFSELCGNKTADNVTRSGERFSLNKTITESFEEQRLVRTQELFELRDGEMIVFPTMQRKDLQGNKVVPLPIFNKEESSILYRHEYLREFDPEASIPYEHLSIQPGAVTSVDLSELVFDTSAFFNDLQPKENPSGKQLKEVFTDTLLQYMSGLIPPVCDVDFDNITVETFAGVIDILHNEGDIDLQTFSTLMQIINGKENIQHGYTTDIN